jgi:uncharacterized protein
VVIVTITGISDLMLFGKDPKEDVNDLFDRRKEIKSLLDAFRLNERLSIVYGIRRIGKTSLIKSALNEKEWPYVFIDVRELYLKHSSISIETLADLIETEFMNFIKNIGEVKGTETRRSLGIGDDSLTELLKDINEWCKNRKISFVIAFDEAQYLRFSGNIKYDMLLAWSVDNLSNIVYVLSGSEIGVLKDFLNYENVKAPLYGRFRNEIYLNRLNSTDSRSFLEKGFAELDKKINKNDVEEVVRRFGGTIGWLSYYGYYSGVKGLPHDEAMSKIFDDGYSIVKNEIENLIKFSSKRYMLILKAIAKGQNKWSDIKPYVIAKSGEKITDSQLNSLLQNLVKFGIVEKDELRKEYSINDPIVLHFIMKS